MSTGQNWTVIGTPSDIPQRGARVVHVGAIKIAVFRTSDDEIFAIEDRCPHMFGPLSQGIVHGAQVTCPLHNWVIDLKSGGVVGPDDGCVVTVPVKVEDGRVALDLSAFAKQAA